MNKIQFIFIVFVFLFATVAKGEAMDVEFYKTHLLKQESVNKMGVRGYCSSYQYYPLKTSTPWLSLNAVFQHKTIVSLETDFNQIQLEYVDKDFDPEQKVKTVSVDHIVLVACATLVSGSDKLYKNIVFADLSTYDSAPLGHRTPIVLVHGWQPFQNNLINMISQHPELTTWNALRTYINTTKPNDYKIFQFRYPSFSKISNNGAYLAEAIKNDPELRANA